MPHFGDFKTPVGRRSTAGKKGLLSSGTSGSGGKYSSPLGRKSYAPPTDGEVIDVPRVDDELELQGEQAAARSDRRVSLPPIAGFSYEQVSAHYSSCVKLSTENKINKKNAYNLHLIDCMAQMVKRDQLDNFQVASATLDASAKIYGCRVEALHGDTMRMAGDLGRRSAKQKPDGADGEDGADGAADDAEPAAGARKRKTRRKALVEQNVANLNIKSAGKSRSVTGVALLLRRGTVAGDAVSCVEPAPDDDNRMPIDLEAPPPPPAAARDAHDEPVEVEIELPDADQRLCAPAASFTFRFWRPEDEDSDDEHAAHRRSPVRPDATPAADPRHRFDVNAHSVILEESMEEPYNCGMDDDGVDGVDAVPAGADGGGGAGGDTHVTVGGAGCHAAAGAAPPIDFATIISMLSAVPQEYSYFDQRKLLTWAGPKHWKMFRPAAGRAAAGGGAARVGGRKKAAQYIEYDAEVDFNAALLQGKRSLTLKPATLRRWSRENSTLPLDLHYTTDKFFRLFKRPDVVLGRQQQQPRPAGDGSPGVSQQDLDASIADYEQDHPPDTLEQDYCPQMPTAENCEDYDQTFLPSGGGTGGIWDKSEIMSMTTVRSMGDLIGSNLVQAPKRVDKITIAYARTAKKMDMRKLKASIWDILTEERGGGDKVCSPETPGAGRASGRPCAERMPAGRQYSFRELYHRLPAHLSAKMADSLSVALGFFAVLHLVNDRCLSVAGAPRLDDFFIAQDSE